MLKAERILAKEGGNMSKKKGTGFKKGLKGEPPKSTKKPTEFKAGLEKAKLGAWFLEHDGRFHPSDNPAAPAVLLFHGLHQSSKSWTKPSFAKSGSRWYYDYRRAPADVKLRRSYPNAGIFKVGKSDRLDIDPLNWFDFLVERGFTVATWTQPGVNFAEAYASAEEAYEHFLEDTEAMSGKSAPGGPAQVALVGHSRGGLLIRKLLQEKGSKGRVRAVVTLHCPHHGSEMAEAPERICDEIVALSKGTWPGVALAVWELAQEKLFKDAVSFCKAFNEFIDEESRELAPGSRLIRELNDAQDPKEVTYYTYGGTSPTLIRYYYWPLTPMSAVPQFKKTKMYFIWEANAVEIPVISPLLNSLPDIAPEITPGKGDGLVTAESASLPFSEHATTDLNHAEVLWDRALQMRVAAILQSDETFQEALKIKTGTR